MSEKSGRKKKATKKILDMLPQDLVKNIVGKILERAEEVRTSLTSEEEPKTPVVRKAKKAVSKAKKTVKKAQFKLKQVEGDVKAKAKKVKAKVKSKVRTKKK